MIRCDIRLRQNERRAWEPAPTIDDNSRSRTKKNARKYPGVWWISTVHIINYLLIFITRFGRAVCRNASDGAMSSLLLSVNARTR